MGPDGSQSFVQEPSSDNFGRKIFQTGNWYATRSLDSGATWQYINPFTIFGSGFCCDQVTIYDPSRDRWFWLLQFNDHLTIASSGDLVSWCSWNLAPTNVGADGEFDYNDLALSNNFLYFTSNIFGTSTWSTIVRMPLDTLAACGQPAISFATRSDLGFTFKPISGATDVMYWGTNWYGGSVGSVFRVFKWAESSSGYSWSDLSITPFSFETRNSGQNCGGGAVTNWCQFSDSRVLGAARYTDPTGNTKLVFSMNSKQWSSYPYPYTERVYVSLDGAYLGSDRVWASWAAFQYMSMATNGRGHVGMTVIYGGTGLYPSGTVLLQDDVSPNQPWQRGLDIPGHDNTCTDGSGLYRYGDYMTTRPLRPSNVWFMGSLYVIAGPGACNNTVAANQPHNVAFGRTNCPQLASPGTDPARGQLVSWSQGRLDLFLRSSSNTLRHEAWGPPWGGPESLGAPPGGLASEPVAVAWAPLRLDVFAIGSDGGLYHKAWDSSPWSGWEAQGNPGAPLTGQLAVAAWSANRLDIFARTGSPSALWHKAWDGSTWSGWEAHGSPTESVGDPTLVSWEPGRLDLFAVGSDGKLYHQAWPGGFYTWEPQSGPRERLSAGAPAVAAWSSNRLDVFAVDRVTCGLWHHWWDGASWSAWEGRGGDGWALTSDPSVVSWAPGRLDVFGLGTNSSQPPSLLHRAYQGGWSGWDNQGRPAGTLAGRPATDSWGPDRIDVFTRTAPPSTVFHNAWQTPGPWGYWENHGAL